MIIGVVWIISTTTQHLEEMASHSNLLSAIDSMDVDFAASKNLK